MGSIMEEGMNFVIVDHYNHSGKWERPRSGGACKMAVLLFICVLIVLENVTVLLALWRNKRFHSRMYFLIGNLALSDLLAGVAYVVNIFTSGRNTFFLTPRQWLAREGSMFVALSASTFSLLAIGIERHMTMVRLRPCETAGRGRLLALLVACWLVSVLLSALPSLGWNCLNNLSSCSTVLPLYAKSYIAFCISVFSALLVAIIILYIRIYRLVTSSSRRVSSRPSERSLALLRTVVIVLGVFVMCWAPLFLLLLLDVGCSPDTCPVLYQPGDEGRLLPAAVLLPDGHGAGGGHGGGQPSPGHRHPHRREQQDQFGRRRCSWKVLGKQRETSCCCQLGRQTRRPVGHRRGPPLRACRPAVRRAGEGGGAAGAQQVLNKTHRHEPAVSHF
uniref:Sphingosine-1-phosphate receptor 3a n=1 Tax=Oryzias melastigma TaxID=30732 RepID=A0A3B3BQU3_ORYME